MTEELIKIIGTKYPLKEIDAGEFSKMKVSGMNFEIKAYEAQGFGKISVMTASGMMGLMKMDTVMVGPRNLDAPFLSYDYVHAMGNETVMLELYNCVINDYPMPELDQYRDVLKNYEDYIPTAQWYEYLTLPQTLCKKGKKKDKVLFDKVSKDYFNTYMEKAALAPPCDPKKKNEKISEYCEGLINNGGPAVNTFIKAYGKEKTGVFLRTVLFGTAE